MTSEAPPESDAPRARAVVIAATLALLYCASSHLFFGGVELHLGDEGYLWYGVQRTFAGAVPMRDFQSYEPGRYYWCAALAHVVGDGILGVRAAAAAFQAVGLTLALLVVTRFARSLAGLAASALLLGLWMFPSHKLFEPALASAATWFAVRLVERPTRARHFALGAFAGFAGFFGPNHAVYAALAGAVLIALIALRERASGWPARVGAWASGGVAGYLPMGALLLFVPGFAAAFGQALEPRLEHGTNLPLPYPWPWRLEWSGLGAGGLVSEFARASAFLLPCVVVPLGLVSTLRAALPELRRRAPVAGAACVALFYLHHVGVRSDAYHLAECSPPVLLLALALIAERPRALRVTLVAGLALVSALFVLAEHPVLSRWAPGAPEVALVPLDVRGEVLQVDPEQAKYLSNLRDFVETSIAPEEPIFIAPNRPTLYAFLGRVAPTWWIDFFWPASDAEQQALIDELAERHVNWVVIVDKPIDGREDMRFRRTHPRVHEYLTKTFGRVVLRGMPSDTIVLRRAQ